MRPLLRPFPLLLAATLFTATLLSALPLRAQTQPRTPPTPAEAAITAQLRTLRSLSATERPVTTRKLALDIRALPAGPHKLGLALGLASLATEGDAGLPTLTDVTLTLAESLDETPLQPKTPDAVPYPYLEVARLIRYEHVALDPRYLADPLFARADAQLVRNDQQIESADFTLHDLNGKPVKLSALRGSVVLVNFWAAWCPPCRKEMPALDALYARFQPQGLVVLSISDEDAAKVAPFIAKSGYRPTVLLDPGSTVHQQFHVEGIPKSFVFDRNGHLVAQTIDERTEQQFLAMLTAAGLKN
jgi:peroxiredoxin